MRRVVALGLFVVAVLGAAVAQGARASAEHAAREARSREISVAIADGRYRHQVFDKVDVYRNVAYRDTVTHAGKPVTLRLDVYAPSGDTSDRRPAMIWLHSGGYSAGDKSTMAAYATDLARRGFVSVSINYRVRPKMQWFEDAAQRPAAAADAFDDAGAAVDFLRDHADEYGIDPQLIFAGGYSAGAVTAFDLAYPPAGVSSPPIAGAVSISGYTNDDPRPGRPPVLVFHGTADPFVPYTQATESCQAAIGVGGRCEMVTYQGGGHDIGTTDRPAIEDRVAAFLTQLIADSA